MIKAAYEMGVMQAMVEAGLVKEAAPSASMLSKALSWGAKNPMATSTAAGAGIGGLGGAVFGDEGGFARGALMGAGAGAGLGYGMGAKGRAAASALGKRVQKGTLRSAKKGRSKAVPALTKATQKDLGTLGKRWMPAAGGLAAGGLGAGLLGHAAIPEPSPWYR